MKKALSLLMISMLAVAILSPMCFGALRWGAFSDVVGTTTSGLLLRIDKTWDVQIMYSTTGAGANSTYGVAGTYYFTSVRTLDFGGFLQYSSGSAGGSTIDFGGSVRTPFVGEIGIKADVFVLRMTSGTGSDGTALFPAGARIGLVIVI